MPGPSVTYESLNQSLNIGLRDHEG